MTKYIYNHKKDTVDDRDFKFHLHNSLIPVSNLPSSVDLRRGNLPPVLDQGELGSCTANATSNTLRFLLRKEKLQDYQPSRLFIYYFSRLIEGTQNEDSGCLIRDVMKCVSKYGSCSEHLLPYNVNQFTIKPNDQCQKAGLQHIKNFKYMSVNQDITCIKNALAQGYPIVFGVNVYDSFESDTSLNTGHIPIPDTTKEKNLGGHCILLIAYDDNGKYFTFMNSWGIKVGQNGFFTLPYNYVLDPNLSSDFWICENYI